MRTLSFCRPKKCRGIKSRRGNSDGLDAEEDDDLLVRDGTVWSHSSSCLTVSPCSTLSTPLCCSVAPPSHRHLSCQISDSCQSELPAPPPAGVPHSAQKSLSETDLETQTTQITEIKWDRFIKRFCVFVAFDSFCFQFRTNELYAKKTTKKLSCCAENSIEFNIGFNVLCAIVSKKGISKKLRPIS